MRIFHSPKIEKGTGGKTSLFLSYRSLSQEGITEINVGSFINTNGWVPFIGLTWIPSSESISSVPSWQMPIWKRMIFFTLEIPFLQLTDRSTEHDQCILSFLEHERSSSSSETMTIDQSLDWFVQFVVLNSVPRHDFWSIWRRKISHSSKGRSNRWMVRIHSGNMSYNERKGGQQAFLADTSLQPIAPTHT